MTPPSDAPRVKLRDIADEAGVSLSTISKVLNGRTDISADTRQRVETLLAQRGYERRGSGSEEPRSDLVELVFHELEASWSTEIIAGVDEVASAHGLSVVLTESGGRHSPSADWLDRVLRRRPAGIVLVASDVPPRHRGVLEARGIPFAIIDPAGDPAPGVPAVGSANWAGGLAATRHLIELGHSRIAVITGPRDMMCSLARLDGYRSAMTSAGLGIEPGWIHHGNFYVEGGLEAARLLFDDPAPPTAIFAGSDLQALGVFEAARERGIAIPRDVSVVGYDDVPLARWVSPPLTTIHQPLREMGAAATRIVLASDSGADSGAAPRIDLATHLVVRGSTAPR